MSCRYGTLLMSSVCLLLGAVLSPGAASGATVDRSGGLLFILAAAGEANDLDIRSVEREDGPGVLVTDAGAPLVAGTFCRVEEPLPGAVPLEPDLPDALPSVSCEAGRLAAVVVLTGNEPDHVRIAVTEEVVAYVNGGRGDDLLRGAALAHVLQGDDGEDTIVIEENIGGVDIVEGGDGRDRIDVVKGAGTAVVRCGAGFDIVELDIADRPSDGCEGQAFPSPTSSTTAAEAPVPAAAPVDPVPPKLPDESTARTSARSSGCGLRPRRRSGALTVRLRPSVVGSGHVGWAIYARGGSAALKTGAEPVFAGRRERLTSIARRQPYKVWVARPKPCQP